MVYVNLGCGARFHPDWINLDIEPQAAGIVKADLSKGIPLETSSADVVYHAAVLEHMRRADAARFLQECKRILRKGGILRVGVPDLENIVTAYLTKLQLALDGDAAAEHDYEWMMLELVDQMVRESSGGEMLEYLRRKSIPNADFIVDRIGDEGTHLIEQIRNQSPAARSNPPSTRSRIGNFLNSIPSRVRRGILTRVLGERDLLALSIGRFRLGGEVHQWMYDRFSLGKLLQSSGFEDIRFHTPGTSDVPDWERFHLDVMADGRIAKPDLMFAEARNPGSTVA